MEYVTLNNGIQWPIIGLGTYLISPEDAQISVREALKMGYRCIDTAAAYVNERACGRGLIESGIPREKISISTKLWPSEYENKHAIDESLERLGVDTIDLLFLHQPAGNWKAAYRMLEEAYRNHKIKAIGISNFDGQYFDDLQNFWEIVPQFIQVEAHPYDSRAELRKKLDPLNIKLMSWYPLGHGDKTLLNEPIFQKLAQKYHKSTPQIILRWHTQMGFAVIPGSKNIDHIRDNLAILDFSLSADEMNDIAALDSGTPYYHSSGEMLQRYAAWQPEYEKK